MYKDHPWHPKIVVFVNRWSLFRGLICNKSFNWDLKMWPLKTSSRYSEVVVSTGLTVHVPWFTCLITPHERAISFDNIICFEIRFSTRIIISSTISCRSTDNERATSCHKQFYWRFLPREKKVWRKMAKCGKKCSIAVFVLGAIFLVRFLYNDKTS